MNIYRARWKNALRKAAKVNRMLKKGFLILEKNGEKVIPFQFDSASRTLYQETKTPGHTFRYMMFQDDKHYDHGLYTPIKQFNKRFEGWLAVNPKNLRKLF